jgi:hypothetical protein
MRPPTLQRTLRSVLAAALPILLLTGPARLGSRCVLDRALGSGRAWSNEPLQPTGRG